MERELFTWDGWDGDPDCLIFHNPRLIVDIGDFPMGTVFDSAAIVQNSKDEDGKCVDYGILEFYNPNGDVVATFKLHMKVGERIN